MNDAWLLSIRDALWLYAVLPAVAVGGIWLSVRLRVPQFTRLGEAWKALRHDGASDEGTSPLPATFILTTTMTHSLAAVVGAATSVALSGPGALLWIWLATFLLAPLRVGEALLARTSPPGDKGTTPPTSFVGRLLSEKKAGFAYLLLGFVALTAFGFAGAVNGDALSALVFGVAPDSTLIVAAGIALVSLALAIAGAKRVGSLLGWLAVLVLAAVLVIALITAFSNPARALSGLTRSVRDAIEGAPTMGAFTGALAGEIARVTLLRAVLPLVSDLGSSGALAAMAKAPARRVAVAALLPSLVAAVLSTTLALAFVASGAATEARDTVRPLSDLVAYEVAFETPSQRLEVEGLRNGPMRVRGGELRDTSLVLATERGVIENPRFTYYGQEADLAINFVHGRVVHLARYQGLALGDIPASQAREVLVHGTMLLDGGNLITHAFARSSTRSVPAQLMFAALLVLAVLSSASFGFAASASAASAGLPVVVRTAFAALPAIGLFLTAAWRVPFLSTIGELGAGGAALLLVVALFARSGEIQKRLQ